jgi:hypothetical protein
MNDINESLKIFHEFDIESISEFLHNCISSFKLLVNEQPYKSWKYVSEETKKLYHDVIFGIKNKNINSPKEVHDYWMNYAKMNNPNHASIIEYDKLSDTEKYKDIMVFRLISEMFK